MFLSFGITSKLFQNLFISRILIFFPNTDTIVSLSSSADNIKEMEGEYVGVQSRVNVNGQRVRQMNTSDFELKF